MTSLLSAISGNFSRSLVLGTFFPVALFVLLGVLLVVPLLPGDVVALQPLAELDKEWKTVAVTGTALLLTGLLYNLNIPVIRFYEGYPWRQSWVGRWRTAVHVRRMKRAELLRPALRRLAQAVRAGDPGDARIAEWNAFQSDLGRTLKAEYPIHAAEVLPTRLGNVVRSFEEYPRWQYGISAIPLWPRLVAVIDKEYAAMVEDAKSSLDFMLNCSLLSGLLAATLLFAGLLAPGRVHLAEWLVQVAVLGSAAYVFYTGSVARAHAWGAQVRGAFDLYRGDLMVKLGYGWKPATPAEERELWRKISMQMVFGDPPAGLGTPLAYGPPQPAASPAHPATAAATT
ncbi:MAG TPA: hypothetical protein VFH27_18190 [Longimicrobiaceae bacterium]|nr:hypothetical protein [Longimicrobiaceae bacterium]